MKKRNLFLLTIFTYFIFISKVLSIEIIRDVELEEFTKKILSTLVKNTEIEYEDLNYYFIKSNDINAFVTGGNNLFINTETLIAADDYREYASVLAHELSHILGGHIFRTKEQMNNLSDRAFPVFLLGILGIMGGSADAGVATMMIGSASVQDGFTYYSRNQEASADQAAIKLLCSNNIDGKYFLKFLSRLNEHASYDVEKTSYRSTHPLISERSTWVQSALKQHYNCNHQSDEKLQNDFELVKAKLFGFTHSKNETNAVYNLDADTDKYATAVSSYLAGDHNDSISKLKNLIIENPDNPFFRELLGEIYFSKHDYKSAIEHQTISMNLLSDDHDLYLMMMGNYYIASEKKEDYMKSINYLKKSLRINNKNTYSWYLLAKAYGESDNLPLAEYATAERYYLVGNYQMAHQFVVKSLKDIEKNTTEWYRANDLLNIINNMQNQNS